MPSASYSLGAGSDLAAFAPPCRLARLPDGRAVYIHAYSGAEAARWLKLARLMAGGEPAPEHL
ncbi:MAG: hypothetical protein HUU35_06780, partial [Armatimonadetes bacterium]|nr:hypothetical protein [Armatimonadota bacterium]